MRSLRDAFRTYRLALLFVAINMALLASLYGRLPDSMPWLWSADGHVIRWIAKPVGAVLLPLANLLITLFLVVAPALDPGALRSPTAPRAYPLMVAAISGFLLLATLLLFATPLDIALSVPHALLAATGVLIALIGNYLGKVPKNYMVGIRTPWTLADDHVWERTHRFAAPLFVVSGTALVLHSIVQTDSVSAYFVGTILFVTILTPYFYSCLAWKKMATAKAALAPR